MRPNRRSVALAIAALAMLAIPMNGPALAGSSLAAIGDGGNALVVQAQYQSVYVGSIGFGDRWKCTAHAGPTKYVSTGRSKLSTRRKLIEYGLSNINCYFTGPKFRFGLF